jgi:hypothetical protein
MKYCALALLLLLTACRDTDSHVTIDQVQSRIKGRWPHISFIDLQLVNGAAVEQCIPTMEKMAKAFPDAWSTLLRLGASKDAGWPGSTVAWYDRPTQTIWLRQSMWDSPSEGSKCDTRFAHEFGHHVDGWLRGIPDSGILNFTQVNAKLGKEISDYAGKSPEEAWAESFEEYMYKSPSSWKTYTKKQAEFLKPWRK